MFVCVVLRTTLDIQHITQMCVCYTAHNINIQMLYVKWWCMSAHNINTQMLHVKWLCVYCTQH